MVDLIEQIVGEDDLLSTAVSGVRAAVREVAPLTRADIAGHTRALLVASTRALAARRGPVEAELSFVEELAVTRAGQGVPIEAVLRAIHVAERAIWSRAREAAAANGIHPDLLLDARELYEDWAEAVRSRLIAAHRAAQAGQRHGASERTAVILRRLLAGGSAAGLAAAEAGLRVAGGLWVAVARTGGGVSTAELERVSRESGVAVIAPLDEFLVGVLDRPPSAVADGVVIGVAGPAEAEELATVHRLATAALTAAEATGYSGIVHIAQVAVPAALADRADLAAALLDRHGSALAALGANTDPVVRGVCAWLEADRDTDAAAKSLFVHANTVRNRVQRFSEVTGLDPHTTFGAMTAWWLCRAWLAWAA
ncbi:PucR family transcriptional regulator [Nocardia sp. CT2-14]|uniref:PucR family transcriptional regulator n=2 Tax=Nocardia aurantiaca TaxID=2675850 RepID=A0A6I3KS15_9NOCA|nr:PucR family transcriptional regulator [Nocardia aurantiaca]